VDKQVLTPDDELERHMRQIAGLPPLQESIGVREKPEPPEPPENTPQDDAEDTMEGEDDMEEEPVDKRRIRKEATDIGRYSPAPCPLCSEGGIVIYDDHGGLAVCKNCGKTFDPRFHYGKV